MAAIRLSSLGASGAPSPAASILYNATQTSASATVTQSIPAGTYSVVSDYPCQLTINSVNFFIQGGATPTIITVATTATTMTIKNLSLGCFWSNGSLPSSGAVAWNGTVFCVVVSGTSIAYTSPDGITWTQRTLPSSSQWNSIAWNGTVFCAISSTSGTVAATSPDGITWTARTLAYSLPSTPILAASSSLFVLMTSGTSTYQTSPDGITWTQRSLGTSNGAPGGINGITSANYNATLGLFIAAGSAAPITTLSQNFTIYSADGINWKIGGIWNNYYTYPQVVTPSGIIAFNGSNLMVDGSGHYSSLLPNPFGIYAPPTTTI